MAGVFEISRSQFSNAGSSLGSRGLCGESPWAGWLDERMDGFLVQPKLPQMI